ncbi:restriction endonuclease subunit S [Vibrio parahaemolyticus]|nr:restriction endonuclease subunit S [Vibrio parahaemolyticus]ELB2199972.1 restriction endonuclease subunit S [Vibrio parahaemolyticus]ELB2229732.1 restriction endonuclease subunit S [Vibrio parahaemolyticus]HCG9126148.1 restriction endonuclease subunit S [Vibrio parahaemolyticus]
MEWVNKPLGEVCRLINGRAYKKHEMLDSGPYPLLRVGNFFSNRSWYYSDLELVEDKYCDQGDLLYAWSASFGPRIWDGGKVIYHYHIWKILPDEDVICKEYLFYFLEWDKELIKAEQGTGSTMIHVTKASMEQRKLPLCNKSEQQKIVTILDKAFADIEQARANTEQNLQNARELFDSYLQQVFSECGDGYEEKTLKEISLDFGRGKSKHRPRNDESLYGGQYPFIQTGDVRNSEHVIKSYSKTYNDKGLSQSKLWPKGTICITIAANIAETGILDFDACFPDSVIGIVVDPKLTSISYVEFLLQSFKAILKAKGKGSAQDNINLGTFEKMHFPFPSIEKQNEIVTSLNQLLEATIKLEAVYAKKINSLDELKQSLLQQAFTGQLTQG